MLEKYKSFLKEFDSVINNIFESQKDYIYCKRGCSECCECGEYPFSRIEFMYLTKGYLYLPPKTKSVIQRSITELLEQKKLSPGRFEHKCPFLINQRCSVYEYRGIICRTFGVCYYDGDNKYVRLPDCVHHNLNYSNVYDFEKGELLIKNVPQYNLRIDKVLNSKIAKKYNLTCSDIRPMLEWIEK